MGSASATQVSLFDLEGGLIPNPALEAPHYRPGDLVRQARPIVGTYETVKPFWQVRHSKINEGWGLQYYCHSVPVGVWGGEPSWFSPEWLVPLGFNLPVPSWEDIGRMCVEGGCNQFHRTTSESHGGAVCYIKDTPEAARALYHGGQVVRSEGPYIYIVHAPHRDEAELVALLEGLPWQPGRVTRDNFYEWFPRQEVGG